MEAFAKAWSLVVMVADAAAATASTTGARTPARPQLKKPWRSKSNDLEVIIAQMCVNGASWDYQHINR
eukprot:scaffold303880_cov39-Prasinocladus_malaysianus.AAC.2